MWQFIITPFVNTEEFSNLHDNHVNSSSQHRSIFMIQIHMSFLLLGSLLIGLSVMAEQNTTNADPNNKTQVELGKQVYKRSCALCHGIDLEGQPNWRIRRPDGRLPAPPHDGTGHTWHHPDDVLFGITKFGLIPPYSPEDYQSDMPALGGILSDEEIWAVLAYIKSRWSDDILKIQQDINARDPRQSR